MCTRIELTPTTPQTKTLIAKIELWIPEGEANPVREKVTELVKRDTPKEYREAAQLLDQGLALRPADPYFVATHAEVSAILWAEEGYPDEQAKAKQYTDKAIA